MQKKLRRICFYSYICNNKTAVRHKHNKMKKIAIVNTLAAEIRKHTKANRSESMLVAWRIVNATPDCEVLTFTKVSGEKAKRVVSVRWYDYQASQNAETANPNTAKTNKCANGLLLFADLAKYAANIPCVISTYPQNITR